MSRDEAVRYRVDANLSRFIVRAFAGGIFSVFARNPTFAIRDFSGEAEFAPHALEKASLSLKIKAASLELIDDTSEKDRKEIERVMREEVLETSRYPEIVFESTAIQGNKISEGEYRLKIAGDLFLHGVTNKCSFDSQVRVASESLRAQGEFSLRQTDYRIKLVSAAGRTIKVKDELKLSFDILAREEGE
jgi:polyisoprenoid-binding protein YceI